jgi:ABC-type uncharacterized transport system permease subunit
MLKTFFSALTLSATIRLATPLILTGMGGLFADRANVFNIGLESFMLLSAFFAMLGSYLTTSPLVGLIFGIVSSLIASIIFGVLVIYLKSNPVVVGIAMNLSAWGITTLLLDTIFNIRGAFMHKRITSFQSIELPIMGKIPFIKDVLSGHNVLVYIALISVILCYIVVFKTPFGLRLRGLKYNETAVQTAGVNTNNYKWITILLSGIFAGISGSFLPLGGLSMFTENMSAGKGFLALAAIMIGNGNPLKVFFACLIFAYADALSVGLQGFEIPSQIVLMAPYLATVLVLFIERLREIRYTSSI